MFSGSLVALITPFKNGRVDENRLADLIEWHLASGTHGIVPCSTTGESATLSHEEHTQVVKFVVKQVNKRIPVVAGTGSNSTTEAIRLTREAQEVGADGALMISPYYNRPTQEGDLPALQSGSASCTRVSYYFLQYPRPDRFEYRTKHHGAVG